MALLLERLRAHLDRARLFPAPGSAVLAVSGGPDSVALLDLMLAVARERGLSLVVAHADHGIRADSRTVGQSVGELARRPGRPLELGELELGPGAPGTAARGARYAGLALVQRRHAARYLVTAHHADDQVETILLRVLKGSGPAGLAGMPARGRGGIVRPLLPFSRAELAVHVAERGLAFHDDPANRDPRHLRSWLRVTLLPQLVTRLGTNLRAGVLRLGRAAAVERRAWDRALELVPELRLQRSAGGALKPKLRNEFQRTIPRASLDRGRPPQPQHIGAQVGPESRHELRQERDAEPRAQVPGITVGGIVVECGAALRDVHCELGAAEREQR